MRSDRDRLIDILEATEKIERYTGRGKDAYDSHEGERDIPGLKSEVQAILKKMSSAQEEQPSER